MLSETLGEGERRAPLGQKAAITLWWWLTHTAVVRRTRPQSILQEAAHLNPSCFGRSRTTFVLANPNHLPKLPHSLPPHFRIQHPVIQVEKREAKHQCVPKT